MDAPRKIEKAQMVQQAPRQPKKNYTNRIRFFPLLLCWHAVWILKHINNQCISCSPALAQHANFYTLWSSCSSLMQLQQLKSDFNNFNYVAELATQLLCVQYRGWRMNQQRVIFLCRSNSRHPSSHALLSSHFSHASFVSQSSQNHANNKLKIVIVVHLRIAGGRWTELRSEKTTSGCLFVIIWEGNRNTLIHCPPAIHLPNCAATCSTTYKTRTAHTIFVLLPEFHLSCALRNYTHTTTCSAARCFLFKSKSTQ